MHPSFLSQAGKAFLAAFPAHLADLRRTLIVRQRAETRSRHRQCLSIEGLEMRDLLSITTATNSQSLAQREAFVRHRYHEYVSKLQRLELKSTATPAEFLALRDDARAIAQAASATSLSPQAVQAKAVAVTLQLDRAPLDGFLDDSAWEGVAGRLKANLDGLNVSQELIDHTIADMKAIARSAGVTSDDYRDLSAAADSLKDGEARLRNSLVHFPDPNLYFTQHLRGFFRGAAVQKKADETKLNADLRAIQAQAQATPSEAAVVNRDARLLERIGAALTTEAAQNLDAAFVTAFAHGAPSEQAQSQLRQEFRTALGAAGSPSLLAAVDRLIADTPSFFQAMARSPQNVATIVQDVQAVVDYGGGSRLNPFNVQIIVATNRFPGN
jgi:hypothetical protein